MAFFPFLLVGFTALIILASIIISQIHKSRSNLPRGKTGWPILGETMEYVTRPEEFIRDRMRKHSPEVFKTCILEEKVAVLCGASANKFLFTNESKFFSFWMAPSLAAALSIHNTPKNSPTSELVVQQLHQFLRLESLQHYVGIMESKAREHFATHWDPFDEVKVQPLSKLFTFTLSCCLLVNCGDQDQVKEVAEPFFDLHKGTMSKSVSLPFYRARKVEAIVKKLLSIIEQRKMDIKSKGDKLCQDLLGQLILASIEKGVVIDEREIAGRINSLLFASFYTISTTLTFLVAHLADYPQVYAKVLQEQLEIAESKEPGELLNWKDIQKMKYSWNVVRETMRLKPPALGSYREVTNDFTFAGFKIPKGWKVHWNVYSTHKDPKYFPDPENFDPSRFENNLSPYAYVPFGAGPLMCGGKEYARIEILVFLHNVITRFKLSRVNPDEKIIYSPIPTPVEGLRIRLHPRQK